MLAGSQSTGLCYMVSFFINVFRLCAFRTIANDTKSFKLFSIWFYDITFINEDHWFRGNESLYGMEIRSSRRSRRSSEDDWKAVLQYSPSVPFHEAGRKYQ